MLNMMERLRPHELGIGTVSSVHWKTEIMKRAFADRAQFLGDPDFTSIPTDRLISKGYARKRLHEIHPAWPTASRRVSSGRPPLESANETTHFSVTDRYGNGVATTTTINGSFGSGVTVTGAGFLMNNEMDDFAAKPGKANMFGLIEGEANAVGPRKRPLSSMTPTLVRKDGELYLLLGSPGGPTIINTVFNVLSNVIDHRLDIQEAVDAPRFHHQWIPDRILVEEMGLSPAVISALRKKGLRFVTRQQIGDAHCIMVEPGARIYLGAADPRSESKASGY
jgi:gamma-glutamyltranspeptidase/glutathione hydrolase